MKWTDEQQRVIHSRQQNLLVSAAAGSGKTAVLVEHILERISDPGEQVNISDLLVVTFTRAAAAEMRERLSDKLMERLEEEPENRHLERQISLLGQAHISTIDSFCQWMVKNYFYELNIDPDFRIAEEGEQRLLKEDILDQVLEESFRTADEDFLHLAAAFGGSRDMGPVRDMVKRLAVFSESQPWPEEWLASFLERYTGEVRKGEGWQEELCDSLKERLSVIARRMEEAAGDADAAEGLALYADMFRSDLSGVRRVLEAPDLEQLMAALPAVSFMRKPAISKKTVYDAEKKEELSALRDMLKKQVGALAEKYGGNLTEALGAEAETDGDRRALIRLTQRFLAAYRAEKSRRNMADFADVEHWALDLLIRREEGVSRPTALAEDLGRTFREIIVDEYQDSNLVQESILRTLSGESRGEPNMFMVGDVKQSIYKFRMARPELFMEKYRAYKEEDRKAPGTRIDLSRNFRSRETVLRTVNQAFSRLMGEGLGGVEYDRHAALYYGADFPEPDPSAEMLILETGDSEEDAKEQEAWMIADRIRRMTAQDSDFRIWDGKRNCFRRPEYRDIVILMRTAEGWTEPFLQVLTQAGIPAAAQTKSGYFAAREIRVLLNFLRLLDNPLSDIPLSSVLLSPLGGFTAQELAEMAAGLSDGPLWNRLEEGAALGRCREKWEAFAGRIRAYRRKAALLPIHELLEEVLNDTDYRLILAAQPDGRVRTANVEMLLEQAMSYEETSYHGIFQFLRYMDQLNRYEVDFGEAQVLSEQENLVRITTIHRSKGLEYPVVIVAGCGKGFNLMDARANMLIQEDLGLACDYIDPDEGLRYPVLWKKVVQERMEQETKGEELRVLYVAMTRAKEKLILTGSVKDVTKLEAKWSIGALEPEGRLSPSAIMEGSSYLEWLGMAWSGSENPVPEILQITAGGEREEERARFRDNARRALLQHLTEPDGPEIREDNPWERILNYHYPWENITREKTVYSVSELKHAAADSWREAHGADQQRGPVVTVEDAEGKDREYAGREAASDGPGQTAADRGTESGGAFRGTAYHKALELLSPSIGADIPEISRQLDALVQEGSLSREERRTIRSDKLAAYFRSRLGQIAARAGQEGRLHREQTFVMQVPLSEILPVETDEWVVVQGIIDAWAETEEGIILWDYKTDALPEEGGEEYLRGMYAEQLRRYRDALERAGGRKVTEMWLYSFTLDREIRV